MNSVRCVCEVCGARMWPRNQSRRCTACRLGRTQQAADAVAALGQAERDRELDAEIARKDAWRAGRDDRLAAIRAAQTAKQRRFMGLPA